MAAPTVFSAALEKWIFEKAKDSIFFVQIRPNLKFKDDLVDLVKAQSADQTQSAAETVEEDKIDDPLDKNGNCCTGFIVEQTATQYRILTSAHIIAHVFTRLKPISVIDANKYFHTEVLCDHYESSLRRQNSNARRVYAKAEIIGICCRRDLMLIGVPKKNVKNLTVVCNSNHPPLALSLVPPEAFDECVMISWPPKKHRSTAKGRISHPSRTMEESNLVNPAKFVMKVMQVQLESEYGSSGAPLLNARGDVIGILHGGFGRSFSYFVALDEIILFLRQEGVIIRQDQ